MSYKRGRLSVPFDMSTSVSEGLPSAWSAAKKRSSLNKEKKEEAAVAVAKLVAAEERLEERQRMRAEEAQKEAAKATMVEDDDKETATATVVPKTSTDTAKKPTTRSSKQRVPANRKLTRQPTMQPEWTALRVLQAFKHQIHQATNSNSNLNLPNNNMAIKADPDVMDTSTTSTMPVFKTYTTLDGRTYTKYCAKA